MCNITEKLVELLTKLIDNCIEILGKPPCKYAFLSLGSMARKEMIPYSDLEFVVLIEKDTKTNRNYFTHLVQLLELKVINLNETSFSIMGEFERTPALPLKGFCIDQLVTFLLSVIIHTPEKLADYHKPQKSDEHDKEQGFLRDMLKTTDFITGDRMLVEKYEKKKAKVLQFNSKKNELPTYKIEALRMMSVTIADEESKIGEKKVSVKQEKAQFFNIKENLYRLTINIIDSLALYYNLNSKNSWGRLEELYKEELITNENHRLLRNVLDKTASLRILTHLHYKYQREDVLHKDLVFDPHVSPDIAKTIFQLQDQDLQNLTEIYKSILPLCQNVKLFCKDQGSTNPLKLNVLFDESLSTKAEIYKRFHQYEKAQECYQQTVSVHSNDFDFLMQFGELLEELGRYREALGYYEQAFNLVKGKNTNLAKIANSARNLGSMYRELDDLEKAKNLIENTLAYIEKMGGPEHSQIIFTLNLLGSIYITLENYSYAKNLFERALTLEEKLTGKDTLTVAAIFNNLGIVYKNLKDIQKAKELYEKSLAIQRKFFKDDHPTIAAPLLNLGSTYLRLNEPREAKKLVEYAFDILEKKYGKNHPRVSGVLINLGQVYGRLGDQRQQKILLQHALEIVYRVYGKEHRQTALTLCNLCDVYRNLKDYVEEKKAYKQLLIIEKKLYGINHKRVLDTLLSLGLIYSRLAQPQKAISYWEQALALEVAYTKENHENVRFTFILVMRTLQDKDQYEQAKVIVERAITFCQKLHSEYSPITNFYRKQLQSLDEYAEQKNSISIKKSP